MKFEKLIINAAITGIVPTKDMNPNLPITPQEIATDAKRVHALGASIVHIHARDGEGNASHSKEIYREIISRIRQECPDILITVSTSGRRCRDLEKRMEVLELEGDFRPDMASLTLGSLNFEADHTLNPPETILILLERMKERAIRPELEIFDTGMANYARFLLKKGHIEGPLYANLILGSLGTIRADPKHLIWLIDELSDEIIWAASGVGRFAFDIHCLAVVIGGHVRIGLEDSIYMDREKRELATNEKLVLRVRRVAEALGREIATPVEVRGILNL